MLPRTLTLASTTVSFERHRDYVPREGRWANYPVAVLRPIDSGVQLFKLTRADVDGLRVLIASPKGPLRINGMRVFPVSGKCGTWTMSKEMASDELDVTTADGQRRRIPLMHMLGNKVCIVSIWCAFTEPDSFM